MAVLGQLTVSDLEQVLPVGAMLIISMGDYSDYTWHGPVKVVKEFKKSDVVKLFQEQWEPSAHSWKTKEDGADPDDFLPWLVKNGYVESVDGCTEWHVGGYGRFSP